MMLPEGELSWAGHMGLEAAPEGHGADPRRRHDHRVRQHARPGRADVPGAVAAERADPADRAASRFARGRAASPRRGGNGWRKAPRGGGDVVARSGHRLGRRRPGDPDRRAEGRLAAAAARRPRQPPDGRSEPRHPGAGQPLRGAGMRGRHAGRRGARTGRRSAASGWPGRAGAAPARAGLLRTVPTRRRLCRSMPRSALCIAVAPGLRRRAGLRRERRLRARRVRSLAQAVPRQRGPRARSQRTQSPASTG